MAEPRSAAEEAGDPGTAPERLIELTESRPQLHRLLVLNPSTPEVARQWILATDPWARAAYEEHRAEAEDAPDGSDGSDAPDGSDDAEAAADDEPAAQHHRVLPTSAPAWEDIPDEPVWGAFLGASAAAASSDAAAGHTEEQPIADPPPPAGPERPLLEDPSETDTGGVRIASPDSVVPLGPAPSAVPDGPPTAVMPVAAQPKPSHPYAAQPYPADPYATSPMPAQLAPAPSGEEPGEPGRRRLGIWLACGGCLVLALVLVLAAVLVGRSLFGGEEEPSSAPSTSATTTEETSEAPTEEPTTEEPTEEDPVSPAPEDAIELSAVQSPTGNITCSLSEDSVGCTLEEHEHTDAEDCGDDPFSIAVSEAEARLACGQTYGESGAQTLEYGQSATYGDMACTSRFDGMTCWNTMTGKGFMVSRSEYTTI